VGRQTRGYEPDLSGPDIGYDAYWLPDDFAYKDNSPLPPPPPAPPSVDRLFHYTTAEGLYGILSSGVLRASNFSFLNDATEFTYGRDIAKTVVRRRLHQDIDRVVIKKLLEKSFHRIDERGAASEVYVTCFSTVGDLLSQWRAYGSTAGRYCIQFDMARLSSELIPPRRFSIGAVLYSEAEQVAAAERVLLKFLSESPQTWDFSTKEVIERGSAVLADRLIHVAPLMKHAGFAEECEWRAVEFHLDEEIEFDASSGVLRPYVRLLTASRFKVGRLPISRVIVGAVQHHAQAVKAARLLANKCGYRDVEVTGSSIPFRG